MNAHEMDPFDVAHDRGSHAGSLLHPDVLVWDVAEDDDSEVNAAQAAPAPRTSTAARDLRLSLIRLTSGIWAGAIAGFVIGGIGGRIAMLILRLTSDPSLVGEETDDGFIIGSITGDSFFLIGLCTIAGIAGGLFYLAVRSWIPERSRMVAMGIYGAAVGGSAVLNPGGIDFTELDPLLLAVVMFIALPALYGVALSWLTERFLAREPRDSGRFLWALPVLGLLPLALGGPFGLGVVILMPILWAANRQSDGALVKLWRSSVVTWLGRAALVGLTAWAFVILVEDTVAIL